VLLWFAGLSFVLVWAVFKDTAIDYRLVMLGAVAPDLIDGLTGGEGVLHALAFSVGLLVVVMVATRGRRHARRRLLALPIGTFCHLVLDGMWTRTVTFWWPLFGLERPRGGLPSFERPLWLTVGMEIAGALALAWCWHRFGLDDPARRSTFVRTGRLSRGVLRPEPPTGAAAC